MPTWSFLSTTYSIRLIISVRIHTIRDGDYKERLNDKQKKRERGERGREEEREGEGKGERERERV